MCPADVESDENELPEALETPVTDSNELLRRALARMIHEQHRTNALLLELADLLQQFLERFDVSSDEGSEDGEDLLTDLSGAPIRVG